MNWEVVIGLEVHAQLNTNTKIFSGAATRYGAAPNAQACAIDLGMPGVLPVLNEGVVSRSIKLGKALNATIAPRSVFARKNYFYPDLPKGYQISQFELPVVHDGYLDIEFDGQTKRIGVTRAHLEEDAGKSLHEDFEGQSGIDLNRAGIPLLEIVSEPDMRSAQEAIAYLKVLHQLVVYLDICDGNMQEGSFRCDANVSVRPVGQKEFGTRTEIKNVNSFKFVEQAINYEVARQIELIESGGTVIQQTRLYDPDKQETRPMREKEEANDYRYFPCPDLLPLEISQAMVDEVLATMPELPDTKRRRFLDEYGLKPDDAKILTSTRALADFFEAVVAQAPSQPQISANWVVSELLGVLNKHNLALADSPISPEALGQLVNRILDDTISGKIAKQVFEVMWETAKLPDVIIEEKGLKQVTDVSAIDAIVKGIVEANPSQVEAYRGGKDKLFGFFVGQVMKATQGKANPKVVNDCLSKYLNP